MNCDGNITNYERNFGMKLPIEHLEVDHQNEKDVIINSARNAYNRNSKSTKNEVWY